MRSHSPTWIVLVVVLAAGAVAGARQAATTTAGFSDPDRRVKFATAFADIDRLFTEFATSVHAPGAAWGIVIDGQLAHQGAAGLRDVASKAPVDGDTVFRIASMTKSFTAMSILKLRDAGQAVARRSRRALRARADEAARTRRPTRRSITIRHLLSHSAGFPEDNPWGDQQLAASEADLSAHAARRHPVLERAGHRLRVLELRLRDPRPHRVARLGNAVRRRTSTQNILQPLGMTSTTLRARRRCRESARDRLSLGGRALERGAAAARRRRSARWAACSRRFAISSRYVAVLLEPGRRATAPNPGRFSRSSLREMQQPWRPSGMRVAVDACGQRRAVDLDAATATASASRRRATFRTIVAHSGGLPGFGSLMRWLPDYGVGIIAFGNVTYTGWDGVVDEAIERLRPHRRACARAKSSRRPRLVAARDAVATLVIGWDDALADQHRGRESLPGSIEGATPQGDRRSARRASAPCRAARPFDVVENALRGQWTMTLRARRTAGGDHAGADDAAEGAVSGGAPRAATAAGSRSVRGVVIRGERREARGQLPVTSCYWPVTCYPLPASNFKLPLQTSTSNFPLPTSTSDFKPRTSHFPMRRQRHHQCRREA